MKTRRSTTFAILYLCPCGCPQVAKDLLHLFSSVLQGRDIIGLAETAVGRLVPLHCPSSRVCSSCWMISCNALVIGQTDLSFLFVCFNHCICRETSGIRQPLIHSRWRSTENPRIAFNVVLKNTLQILIEDAIIQSNML